MIEALGTITFPVLMFLVIFFNAPPG